MPSSSKRKYPPAILTSLTKRRKAEIPLSLKRKAGPEHEGEAKPTDKRARYAGIARQKAGSAGDKPKVNITPKTRLSGLSKPPIRFRKPVVSKQSSEEIIPSDGDIVMPDALAEDLGLPEAPAKTVDGASEDGMFFDTGGFGYVDAFNMYASSICGDESDCEKVPPIGPRVNNWNICMSKSTRCPHCRTSAVDSKCETCENKTCRWCKEESRGGMGCKEHW